MNKKRKRRKIREQTVEGYTDGKQKKRATAAMYGTNGIVDYVAVAVHCGSRVIAHRFFDRAAYSDSGQIAVEIVEFVQEHGGPEVHFASTILAPEYNSQGNRTIRISDGGILRN